MNLSLSAGFLPYSRQSSFSARPALKRRLRRGVYACLYWSGLARAFVRMFNVSGAVILMYHSVPSREMAQWIDPDNAMSPERFESQIRYLRRNRNVISLDALADYLDRGETPPPKSVVVTFDDGYRDNLEIAAPILKKYELPATLFLPTSYISEGKNMWIDELFTIFSRRTRNQLILENARYDLSDRFAVESAYSRLKELLCWAGTNEREEILEDLVEQLKSDSKLPRLMMNWDEVRQLRKSFNEFKVGVHTADHLDLTIRRLEVVRDQISRSIEDVRRELNEQPDHFSFPYSRSTPETTRVVSELGLRSSVAGGDDYVVDHRSNCYSLPRVDPGVAPHLFRFWTSGAFPTLPKVLFGRA